MDSLTVEPRLAIYILKTLDGDELGTAFVCSRTFALTSYHCIQRDDGSIVDKALLVRSETIHQATVLNGDPVADWALLSLEDAYPERPLPISRRVELQDPIRVTGWPLDRDSDDATTVSGTIVEIASSIADGIHVLQVHSPEAAVGAALHGLSGSPVIVEKSRGKPRAVGILRRKQIDPQNEDIARGGTLYACRIDDVLAGNMDLIQELLHGECGVYIAHHPKDAEFASRVEGFLHSCGIETIRRDRAWSWGCELGTTVQDLLASHPVVLVVISDATAEYDYGHDIEMKQIHRLTSPIIPLYLRQPRTDDPFSTYRPVRLYECSSDKRKESLLDAVQQAIARYTLLDFAADPAGFQYAPVAWTALPDMTLELIPIEHPKESDER